jgi:hypothetical protein
MAMARSVYRLDAEQLAPDIALLLRLFREGQLHEAVVRQVLKGACWWVSNAQGRRDACDLWSKAALERRRANAGWNGIGFVHEHLIPRNVIEDAILALEHPTADAIKRLLALSRVCVVTPEEDEKLRKLGLRDRLPGDADLADALLERYHVAGIELSDQAC